jgi:hypothetical protein
VYAGVDPVTKRRHYLREVVPAGPSAAKDADKLMRRLASQIDERRNPRTNATVDQMLDRYFEVIDLERNTISTYTGYADRHIRPLIGKVKVGELGGDVFDSFYAELRRWRDHCDRRPFADPGVDAVVVTSWGPTQRTGGECRPPRRTLRAGPLVQRFQRQAGCALLSVCAWNAPIRPRPMRSSWTPLPAVRM